MTITLWSLARGAVYAALFAVLIVMSSTFFPFIGGKYYFFRFMVELGFIFVTLWWAFEARAGELEEKLRRMMSSPLVIAVSLFAFAFLLASLFAYNPHGAFWSNYERGDGGFQVLHYYLFFLLLVLLFDREEDWRYLMKLQLVAAVAMIFYGIQAAAFVDGFVGPYSTTGGATTLERLFSNSFRFQGSLGNPAYVSPYILFAAFYALWVWLTGKRTWQRGVWYGLLLAFFAVFFVLAQTRGAFLGFLVAAFVVLVYIVVSHRAWRKQGLIALSALALITGVLYQYRHEPAVQALPGGRLLDIGFSVDSAQTRLWTWGSARAGFAERPIFGWGPENFSTVFDKYFDPRHFVPGKNTETWFDRAHSVIFDYLAEIGILGLLAYLGMFVTFFWQFLARWRASSGRESLFGHGHFLDALVLAMPIAYLVQGLVLFDVLSTYMSIFFFLAFATFLSTYRHVRVN